MSQNNNHRSSFGLSVFIISFVSRMSCHTFRQCKILPVERGRKGRSGRGATASLKGDRLCEAVRRLEGGSLESGTRERTEGWRGRIGGTKHPSVSSPNAPFPHLKASEGKYLSLQLLDHHQDPPICLFLVPGPHLSRQSMQLS